ncbi:MAG: four helix bundle protein [Gemmatimonadaceae bacterium]|nr:four helix bundle protein [Gemmatimonadaceae bacterium]
MDVIVEQALAEWAPTITAGETADPIWNLLGYRIARCLVDQTQGDSVHLITHVDPKTVSQLSRAVASIGANIAEGYSRRSAADRSRFYGYALGSTREATVWYRSVAWALDASTLALRMAFLAQERRLIIGMLKSVQREGGPPFEAG